MILITYKTQGLVTSSTKKELRSFLNKNYQGHRYANQSYI